MLFSKKDLQKLIIPLMFEQLLAVSVGMVDTLMVSQAGEAAISGVALVDNINRLIIAIGISIRSILFIFSNGTLFFVVFSPVFS